MKLTEANKLWAPVLETGIASLCIKAISAGADLNDADASVDGPPLVSAASSGYAEIVRLLLGSGADPDVANCDGTTALHYAARMGFDVICADLLQAGANPDARDKHDFSPLMRAAVNNQGAICRALVEKGAAVDAHNSAGRTALHYAVGNYYVGPCAELMALGADPHAVPAGAPADYVTPAMLAQSYGFEGFLPLFHAVTTERAVAGSLDSEGGSTQEPVLKRASIEIL